MNDVERMQSQFAALVGRVEALETLARLGAAAAGDELAAQFAAQKIGFPVSILVVPRQVMDRKTGLALALPHAAGRRKLARYLRAQGWSFERIGRVMRCSARSIARWVARSEAQRKS